MSIFGTDPVSVIVGFLLGVVVIYLFGGWKW